MAAPPLDVLCADLAAEQAELVRLVSAFSPKVWAMPTPAAGWTVRDQIAHLAYYDTAATLAMTDPSAFEAELAKALGGDPRAYEVGTLRRELDGPAALEVWRHASADLHAALERLDPAARVPWYGPPMSGASMVTARLMETWAHGQDIVDALRVSRRPTARLRHIAHLGVRTRGFSFSVRGEEPPVEEVRVELTGPGGELWTWGAEGAADRVSGTALDFCLVVTQRRHRADTALAISGPLAERWMSQAQAFAGPPGEGRQPIST